MSQYRRSFPDWVTTLPATLKPLVRFAPVCLGVIRLISASRKHGSKLLYSEYKSPTSLPPKSRTRVPFRQTKWHFAIWDLHDTIFFECRAQSEVKRRETSARELYEHGVPTGFIV